LAIQYITNDHIDFKKWDKCIKMAYNGTIYALSWYLNIVSESWDALIEGDYEKVMPLPRSSILGNDILIQPKFSGQLGVFSTTTLDEENVTQFIEAIPSSYKYIRLSLNKYNRNVSAGAHFDSGVAFDLDLIKSYHKIRAVYPSQLMDMLQMTKKYDLKIVPGISPETVIQFKHNNSPIKSYFFPEDFITLQLLVAASVKNRVGQLCGVYDSDNQLLGAAFFAWSHQKAMLVYYLINQDQLQLPILFYLIDDFIRNNSEKNLIFRFELNRKSALIPLISAIGAKKYENIFLYRNQLPWYLKPFLA